MNRHERVYRRLLAVYPASFRERYEEEMVTLFLDELRDARSSSRGADTLALWVRTLGDLVSTAPGEHLRSEELVPRPLDPATVSLAGPRPRRGLSKAGYAIALLPLWALVILQGTDATASDAMFANPPSILGLPAGIVMIAVAGVLMTLGILAMRWARTTAGRAGAFALLTVPALAIVLLVPIVVDTVLNV
jgi:hypothetical protein